MSSRWKIGLWVAGGTIVGIVAALIVVSVEISRRSQSWMQEWLSHEYNSKVDLSGFHVAIPFPLVESGADDVVLHFQGRQDLPPLIAIKRVTVRTSIWGLIRNTRRISFVQLEGLQINVPPHDKSGGGDGAKKALGQFRMLRFGEIRSENATLKILTSPAVEVLPENVALA